MTVEANGCASVPAATFEDPSAVPRPDRIDELRRMVGEDEHFQRRVWIAQRVGWVALGGFVMLALAGGLGDGPLAAIEDTSSDGALRVRHDAVTRQDSAMHWHIAMPDGSHALRIASDTLPDIELQNIQPAPARQSRDEGSFTLHFDRTAGETRLVTLTLLPAVPGLTDFTVASGQRQTRFRILVLP